jgi:integrase
MGRYPFLTVANQLLQETQGFYAESTQKERSRKFRRICQILTELHDQGRVAKLNPAAMSETDVAEFIAWCKTNLDVLTMLKYLHFLDEILTSVGNNSVQKVRIKRRSLIPKGTQKSIQTISSDIISRLLTGAYALEDPNWDMVAKGAIALYSHSGLRVSELRLAKLSDLKLAESRITVSNPKGKGRWANGEEEAPVMPGIESFLRHYLEQREEALRALGLNPLEVEPLFPHIYPSGKVRYWSDPLWRKLKKHVEIASGVRFRWKDFRPTFAQMAKDRGAPIEAVSKCLRHTNTRTTEQYYARIRSETAFSLVKRAWEAPVDGISIRPN